MIPLVSAWIEWGRDGDVRVRLPSWLVASRPPPGRVVGLERLCPCAVPVDGATGCWWAVGVGRWGRMEAEIFIFAFRKYHFAIQALGSRPVSSSRDAAGRMGEGLNCKMQRLSVEKSRPWNAGQPT